MTGAEMIAMERIQHVTREGWSTDHDDAHTGDQMAMAAACYCLPHWMLEKYARPDYHGPLNPETDAFKIYYVPRQWPTDWSPIWYKPKDRIRDLVRAGALIAAEIDRLLRKEKQNDD